MLQGEEPVYTEGDLVLNSVCPNKFIKVKVQVYKY